MPELSIDRHTEWLEADGLGGFAMGTTSGVRTRRYHGLLVTASTPPSGRLMLVNGFDAWAVVGGQKFDLTSQYYANKTLHPDGAKRITRFENDPWPTWTFRLPGGIEIIQEIFVPHGSSAVVINFRCSDRSVPIKLFLRPFLSVRDFHALHHENPAFKFDHYEIPGIVKWRPYKGLPQVVALSSARYTHDPLWYRQFVYEQDQERGLDIGEDLVSPGLFEWSMARGDAGLIFYAEGYQGDLPVEEPFHNLLRDVKRAELTRRKEFSTRLHKAADAFIVKRGDRKTIIAGYPWFNDWGRDTFIALRGLCLATGRLDDARLILLEWINVLSDGMMPNHFEDQGDAPRYNAVDSALWYIVAVHEFLTAMAARRMKVLKSDEKKFKETILSILGHYEAGTRYRISMDMDALLSAGEAGTPLTWMDAIANEKPVTARIGKPVEVQALWINALRIGSEYSPHWKDLYKTAQHNFTERFWSIKQRCLFDVVDADRRPYAVDTQIRPNQIFAVGGLPFPVLTGEKAKAVVNKVEQYLLTPMGLRTLAPGDYGYRERYAGDIEARDAAYHQGSVWPWLLGPFVEAWVRVHGGTAAAKQEAKEKFLKPLLKHVDEAGLDHISELADAEAPHIPGGCPFQAWSLGELLRLIYVILA